MAFDWNIMEGHIAAGEKSSHRSRKALAGLIKRMEENSDGVQSLIVKPIRVQAELDKIPVDDAKAFSAAIYYLISEIPVLCYTVNHPDLVRKLVSRGVSAIVTDRLDLIPPGAAL